MNEFNKKSRHYLSNVYQLRYGLLLLILVCTLSCESNDSFLPLGLEKSIHYDVKLINKEKKERLFKQSYSLYNKEYNRYPSISEIFLNMSHISDTTIQLWKKKNCPNSKKIPEELESGIEIEIAD